MKLTQSGWINIFLAVYLCYFYNLQIHQTVRMNKNICWPQSFFATQKSCFLPTAHWKCHQGLDVDAKVQHRKATLHVLPGFRLQYQCSNKPGNLICSAIKLLFSQQLKPIWKRTQLLFIGETYAVPNLFVLFFLYYGKWHKSTENSKAHIISY